MPYELLNTGHGTLKDASVVQQESPEISDGTLKQDKVLPPMQALRAPTARPYLALVCLALFILVRVVVFHTPDRVLTESCND